MLLPQSSVLVADQCKSSLRGEQVMFGCEPRNFHNDDVPDFC